MIVAIVDYGSGNLRSAAKAFERAARENEIPAEVNVTSAPEAVAAEYLANITRKHSAGIRRWAPTGAG